MYAYQGAPQEFQTRRLIPVWVYTVVGQWFIHPQGSVVWQMLPNTTFHKGKIFMGYVLSAPDGSVYATVQLGSVQRLRKVLFSMIWARHILGWHHENELPCPILSTGGKEGIYRNSDWNNLWDEICSWGKNHEASARAKDLHIYKSHLWLTIAPCCLTMFKHSNKAMCVVGRPT